MVMIVYFNDATYSKILKKRNNMHCGVYYVPKTAWNAYFKLIPG